MVKKKINIAEIFPKHLFCEYKRENLDIDRDKGIIIPRALYFSNEESVEDDISKLEKFYSLADIIYYQKNTKETISNEVCEMVAKRYSVPVFYRFSIKK